MFKKKEKKQQLELNTSALPDIMFMLLFFFMTVTVLRTESSPIGIDLPEAKSRTQIEKEKKDVSMYLSINNGSLQLSFLDQVFQWEKIETAIQKLSYDLDSYNMVIKIKADKSISMREVNQLKILLRKYDLRNVLYVTDLIDK